MKKVKYILVALLACVLALAFVACNLVPNSPSGNKPPQNQGPSGGGVTGGEIPDDNDVEIVEPDDTEHAFKLISEENGTFTYHCNECGETAVVMITYESGSENAYTVVDNTITFSNIKKKSVYGISGVFYGNIVIDVGEDNKFELEMSGFELYSDEECPLVVLSGDTVTLSAKKSTENFIFDMRESVSDEDDAINSSVYALCDLNIQGKGSLVVKSLNNNGIHTKDDLTVKNLSLHVDCLNNALKGNDSVTIESGDLVLISRQGDGVKTSNSDVSKKGNQRGTVAIMGGDILIYAACDGIDAAYNVTIDESIAPVNLQIYTDKYSKYSEEITATNESVYYVRNNSSSYKYSLKFFNDETDAVWYHSSSIKKIGIYNYYEMTKAEGFSYVQLFIYNSAQQQGQESDYVASSDVMVVNNNYDTIALQQRGNSFSFSWTNYTTATQNGSRPGGFGPGGMGGMDEGNKDKGDHSTKGIKSANQVIISAGTITISAYDDAIHANNDVALENGETPLGNVAISGSKLTIRSNDDGIHGDGFVGISGGEVIIVASYEGIEGEIVEISGGTVSVVSSDDGINGTATSGTAITISGGKLYVYAGGDGVDSNSRTSYSGIIFSGGMSVIISVGRADSSIDTERGYEFSGGYVIGICQSGGMGSESTNCKNFASWGTSKTLSLQKDAYLDIDGVATIKIPETMNALVVCLGKTNANMSSSKSNSNELDAMGVYWAVE